MSTKDSMCGLTRDTLQGKDYGAKEQQQPSQSLLALRYKCGQNGTAGKKWEQKDAATFMDALLAAPSTPATEENEGTV